MEKKMKMSFEEKMNRLDEIVGKVENSVLPLEESLKLYQEGTALIKELQSALDDAEKRIKEVTTNTDK